MLYRFRETLELLSLLLLVHSLSKYQDLFLKSIRSVCGLIQVQHQVLEAFRLKVRYQQHQVGRLFSQFLDKHMNQVPGFNGISWIHFHSILWFDSLLNPRSLELCMYMNYSSLFVIVLLLPVYPILKPSIPTTFTMMKWELYQHCMVSMVVLSLLPFLQVCR